ncbi:trehalose-phosphatase [Rahnella aquatilis]|uniref:Trehalose 6-phosphate phosphatase n=1 Tax=Rahnella aquatilis (strain ATCC 33071 / DSM 4594 / JCM 1683 / NBRC 105701 / NCIMB 13365 / CIP 78.65) TaxID=745277 RepID=H2J255_RAHAC|nr:trehalose-phosphatase [Rahnella aquatilis CIP 78.65 = ATCC 33071]KFD00250.1 trehalose-6-phosphate phosphatase [Rahnella aquatilis CIP 78.65 = ATCC 33071]
MTAEIQENTTETPLLPVLDSRQYAFFFDVDGTLAEIRSEPDAVTIPAEVRDHLQTLFAASSGALALVSGRPVEQLDQLVSPLELPAAGVHGAEMRDGSGTLHRVTLPANVAQEVQQTLEAGMAALPGTLLETKGMAFALHYRQAMLHQQQVLALAESVVAKFPELVLQPGKCVLEIKPRGKDKGAAIYTFMQQTPFSGRIPVFVGDDLTDEKGFEVVNAMQGISVKVGEGSSLAQYRVKTVRDVYRWIEALQRHTLTFKKESEL